MKFNREFINAMDGTGRLLLAFNNVSIKKCMCVCMLQLVCYSAWYSTVYNECISNVVIQIIFTFAPAETWEQCLFTVWWPVQAAEATDCQPCRLANCLLSSARQQSWWQRSMVLVTSSRPEECRKWKSFLHQIRYWIKSRSFQIFNLLQRNLHYV